ncbi:site-specific DNA-methyltransferase [Microbacterium sp. Leaf203]|uniref:site-specific DNA-methyltransferase n=1 Tax=Microbacterium sp. Leaf203 TaxID=1735677 RepID=UPI000AEAD42A|nr:site-specific DNA-methyltransferase [Microbacterium sp. Leaf203]
MTSPDLTQANIDKLAELFPMVITESHDADGAPRRAVDFDLLRQELADHIVEGPHERYQLDWPGKRAAAFAANAPIAKTLRPVREESVDFDTTKNLFIEGDNLEALKLLQESYLGKVKLIYIDPPYNTGNDFVYDDDFAESTTEYLKRSGQKSQTGDRFVANTEANGRFHSDWLSMMYSRLKLARSLLADDGVAIVAIADHEHGNLRLLLDEVFGGDNFLANVVWQGGSKNDARFTSQGIDYMLIYARNSACLIERDVRWTEPKKGHAQVLELAREVWEASGHDPNEATPVFRKRLREMRGDLEPAVFRYDQLDATGRPFQSDNLAKPSATGTSRYDLAHPVTGVPVKMPKEGWRFNPTTMAERISQGRVIFGPDHTSTPRLKRYLDEMDTQAIKPVFSQERASAAYALKKLLNSDVFPYTKDVDVLAKWISSVTQGDRGALVIDFFAGSGSTGHAVMKLNAADHGHRRFILVQLDEAVDHPDYVSIADVARDRLRRAGAQISQGAGQQSASLDVGFRSLHIETSNMADTLSTADDLVQAVLSESVDSVKPDRTDEDLLFEVLLDWGLDLAAPIAVEEIASRRVLSVDDDALIACFAEELNDDLLKRIAARHPLRAVFLDAGFKTDAARINAEQIFREVSPETDVRTI